MKIVYIDNDDLKAAAFFNAVHSVHGAAVCELLQDPDIIINAILEKNLVPDYIFVQFEFKHIPSTALVDFIKHQAHLSDVKIFVVSEYFTRKDVLFFKELNVATRLVRTERLTEALSNIFNA